MFSKNGRSEQHLWFPRYIPKGEINLYLTKFVPAAVRASVSGVVDTGLFWDSMQEPLPQLSRLPKRYKECVTNSTDMERSNLKTGAIIQETLTV